MQIGIGGELLLVKTGPGFIRRGLAARPETRLDFVKKQLLYLVHTAVDRRCIHDPLSKDKGIFPKAQTTRTQK